MCAQSQQLMQITGTSVNGKWRVEVISDGGGCYEDSGEGPFESRSAAHDFAKAEVGVRWRVVPVPDQATEAAARGTVRLATSRARKRHGDGWQYLSSSQKRAAAAAELIEIIAAQNVNCTRVAQVVAAARMVRNAEFKQT